MSTAQFVGTCDQAPGALMYQGPYPYTMNAYIFIQVDGFNFETQSAQIIFAGANVGYVTSEYFAYHDVKTAWNPRCLAEI